MPRIEVLDDNTIDQIAAGEVVERPASVVKELVENAIDAGATAVTVEITDGGKKLIRITDNGCGIEAEQVRRAFFRHATSKIRTAADLVSIASLGFRGEALSSIASVASVELITKTPSAISGTRYLIEGGKEGKLEETGAPDGSTFLVRNLFFNTPARSKFLKSDTAEANAVGSLMEQLALSHSDISFKYIQNRQVRLHTSGNYSIRDVIYSIYGREITRSLLEVDYANDFMKITGFVGKPEIARGNRSFENYYVNGRYVKNNIITKGIEDGYHGFLMQHKFPFVSLHIEMTGNDLDVNVHPSKLEVRFARGAEVYDAICEAVRRALTQKEMIPEVKPGAQERLSSGKNNAPVAPSRVPEPFEVSRRVTGGPVSTRPRPGLYERSADVSPKGVDAASSLSGSGRSEVLREPHGVYVPASRLAANEGEMPKTEASCKAEGEQAGQQQTLATDQSLMTKPSIEKSGLRPLPQYRKQDPSVAPELRPVPVETERQKAASSLAEDQLTLFQEKLLSPQARSRHRLIGQLFDTYWLVQFEDRFYIIDQHAAHEKIYYERLVKQLQEHTFSAQQLRPPLVVSLRLEEEEVLKANRKTFEAFGFEMEHFGGREYKISAVPSDLFFMGEEELFHSLLDQLTGSEGKADVREVFAGRLATMACKAAVKGNQALSMAEADHLIQELLALDNPYHCPHGRPTIISMSRAEIEKKFKRIV